MCLTEVRSYLLPLSREYRKMKLCHKFVLLCMAVLLWAAISDASPLKRQNTDEQSAVAMPRQSGSSSAAAVDDDDDDDDDDDEVADIEDVLDDDDDDEDDDGESFQRK